MMKYAHRYVRDDDCRIVELSNDLVNKRQEKSEKGGEFDVHSWID